MKDAYESSHALRGENPAGVHGPGGTAGAAGRHLHLSDSVPEKHVPVQDGGRQRHQGGGLRLRGGLG